VPSTFLAVTVDGELVGRISIRHELNDWLARHGGHIGYAIVPAHRRLGYATQALSQGLVIARSIGIDEVLIVCNESNIASARVIESCGGEVESVIDGEDGKTRQRRYWIR
jgi:predicted acetyltransferase